MAIFRFKQLTPQGVLEQGFIELPFEEPLSAINYLERSGTTILEIKKLPAIISGLISFLTGTRVKIKRPLLAEYLNNLAILLAAGVPMTSALEELIEDSSHPALRQTTRFIYIDLLAGQSVSEAVNKHRRIFPEVVLHMIRVGEETGSLDKMLKKASEHVQNVHEIISGTKRALLYPAFLSLVVMGATVFWFYYVVPKIVNLFQDMNVTLPWPTKVLIAISNWFQNYFVTTLGIAVLLIFLIGILRRYFYKFRYTTDNLILKLPVISTIVETSLVAMTCEFLGILVGAGVGILKIVDIITDSITNEIYKKKFLQSKEQIKNGLPLSEAFRETNALPKFALRIIAIGDQSGKLEEQTTYVAKVYRQKLNGLVEVLSKSLEPAMLVFIGVLFMMIIGGLLLPIYDLIGNLPT